MFDAEPRQISPMSGPVGVRPRDGFMPNNPQQEAGIRMDPPPSPPLASGTMPSHGGSHTRRWSAGLRLRSHGFRAGPTYRIRCGARPNSGVLLLPTTTTPAALKRRTNSLSWAAGMPSPISTARRHAAVC